MLFDLFERQIRTCILSSVAVMFLLLLASSPALTQDTRSCVRAASWENGASFALALPGIGEFSFVHPSGRLFVRADGTAVIRGELQNPQQPRAGLSLELELRHFRDSVSSPSVALSALGEERLDSRTWWSYGEAIGALVGRGDLQGLRLELRDAGAGLEAGFGANRANMKLGMGSVLAWQVLHQPKSLKWVSNGLAELRLDLVDCETKIGAEARCDRRLAYGIHDEGLDDSQIFQIDLDTAEIELIGPLHAGLDLEALEVSPIDGRIFTLASSLGNFYELDRDTGDLTEIAILPTRRFREIASLAFRADGVLWAFQKNIGLVTIDLDTGALTQQWRAPVNDPVITPRWDAIAWSPNSLSLYGSERSKLFRWEAATRTVEQICGDDFLPDKTEALDFDLNGNMIGGWHNEAADSLRIFEIDPVACTITSSDYLTPFNDIESLGFEEFCNQPNCASAIMYGVQDSGLNDSQIFTLDPSTGETEILGPVYADLDLEAIALDPFTGELYASASTQGELYRVNRFTGDLTLVGSTGARKFREIASLSFHHDGTLWAFQKNKGLITIDLNDATTTKQWSAPVNDPVITPRWDAIAWDPAGTAIYGAERSRLYRWDAITRTAEEVCGPDFLPDKTEGLEYDLEGNLTGGWHDESVDSLRIFHIDTDACTLTDTFELPYNDIESMDFAFPVGCPVGGGGASLVMYGVQDNAFDDSQFFALNLETGQAQTLGPLYPGLDLEGIAFDASTGTLYASASVSGDFYSVDTATGVLTRIGSTGARKFREVASLSFRNDGKLWAFQKNLGLITIDLTDASTTFEWRIPRRLEGITRKWDAIAWNPDGTELYGSERANLFRWDPNTRAVERVCGPDFLPDKTEGLEYDLEGHLTAGWHDESVDRLSIFRIDPMACTLEETYSLPFNDIESLAFEAR